MKSTFEFTLQRLNPFQSAKKIKTHNQIFIEVEIVDKVNGSVQLLSG